MHHFANMYLGQGNYEEAEKLYRETLHIEQRILGPDHPDTANTMTTLANTIAFDHRRNAEAEGLYRRSLEIELGVSGPDHPYTMAAKEGLANVLSSERRYPEAETLLREILSVRQRLLGTDHTDTLLSQCNLATVLKHENRYPEAEKLIREILKRKRVCWTQMIRIRWRPGRSSPTSCSERRILRKRRCSLDQPSTISCELLARCTTTRWRRLGSSALRWLNPDATRTWRSSISTRSPR
jgi:tetratricopeptide (TPR) repeat protein